MAFTFGFRNIAVFAVYLLSVQIDYLKKKYFFPDDQYTISKKNLITMITCLSRVN